MADNHKNIIDESIRERITSIDVFRTLNMMLMVFVNDIDTAGNYCC